MARVFSLAKCELRLKEYDFFKIYKTNSRYRSNLAVIKTLILTTLILIVINLMNLFFF